MDPLIIFSRFLDWIKIKVRLQVASRAPVYFYEREIWWASIGANLGHEEDGKNQNFERPVIVLKKFNEFLLWAVPTTTQCKQNPYYFQYELKGIPYCAIVSQIRAISSKRLIRKVEKLDEAQFTKLKETARQLLI